MVRTAAQYARVAALYERAASDLSLPSQPRAAFAKKASWFRMLAQLERIKTGMLRTGLRHAEDLYARKANACHSVTWLQCRSNDEDA